MKSRHPSWILLATVLAASVAFGEDCPVNKPGSELYGNDALAVVLPGDGRFVFRPQGPGFMDHDGALGIKVGWDVKVPGLLDITGRRLDAPAPPARAYSPYLKPYPGGQSSYVVFPTPGCWEIVASVNEQRLTFVVAVEFTAPGPASRLNGVPRGWRQTGG